MACCCFLTQNNPTCKQERYIKKLCGDKVTEYTGHTFNLDIIKSWNKHYWLLWVVTPTDSRLVDRPFTLNSIHDSNNNPSEKGTHFPTIKRQIPTKTSDTPKYYQTRRFAFPVFTLALGKTEFAFIHRPWDVIVDVNAVGDGGTTAWSSAFSPTKSLGS